MGAVICLVVAVAVPAVELRAQESPPAKTLADCIALALDNHPRLKAAAATAAAGAARARQALANYLPQVSATYSANRRNTSAAAGTGTNLGTQADTFNFYSTGVSFSQLLFDFGQALHGIRAARANQQALAADATSEREIVIVTVKRAYFDLLAARRLLAVAEQTVRQSQQQLELAHGRFDVGLAPKFDVTRAQVQLASAELNQLTARNNVALARETLANALGLTGALDFEILDTLDAHELHVSESEALAAAYDHRPELHSLRAQQLAATEQVAALQTRYLPYVTGGGNYTWTGSDYPLQSSWNLGASVNLSIFNGGLTAAQIGEAKANLSQVQFTAEVTRQTIALEVRQAALNLEQAAESIRVSEKGEQQARENLELATGRYHAGVGSIIELTDAQAAFTSAEASHVQSLYSYQTAVAALEKATAVPYTAAVR